MRLSDPELERELRAMRPEIDRDFGAKLDEWEAAGFPKREGETERPAAISTGDRLRRAFRVAMPRLAAAAGVLLVMVVSVGVISNLDRGGGDDSDDSGPALSVEDRSQPETTDAGKAGQSLPPGEEPRSPATIEPAQTTVPPVPPRQGQLKPGEEREVARDASMRLSTEPDEVAEVADGVIEVTERYDGIVLSSDVDTRADRGRATFDLRIPAQNLQATLADLSDLASVSERNEGSIDVTAPFITAEERFADAKAEVDALIEQLGEAESADEIEQIRGQLQASRAELAAARAELAGLKQRTDFSTLAVTVVGDGDADGWSIGDAVDDAGSVLEDLAGATLIALAVTVPLGLIVAALWFGLGAARRRSRERTLDD
jgi:Domain of unknown function (DUF4349)